MIARYAFNELVSFIAGWAICLDYLILVALCAFACTDYLGVFWHGFDNGFPEFGIGAAIVLYVALVAIRGGGPKRFERAAVLVLGDLVLQLLVVGLGLGLLFNPDVLTHPSSIAGTPSIEDIVFAFPLVLVAFSGIDASSGLAGQVAIGRKGLRRLIGARLIAALVPYLGIALIASSVLPQTGGSWVEAPLVGVAEAFQPGLDARAAEVPGGDLGVVILVNAAQAAMLGLSRLGYALAVNRQIPSAVGKLHRTRATPVGIIGFGAVIAIGLLIPANLEFLAAICAFGATIAFTIVGLSVCRLRYKEPDRDRPYRMPFNVRVRGGSLPIPGVLCVMLSYTAFVALLIEHGAARWVGLGWMTFGITLYVGYRTSQGKPVFKRVTVPGVVADAARSAEVEFGSILVPVLGTPLDDDIMQTAGRLAAEEGEDDDEGGAVIEADLGLRGPDGAAAGHARARGGAQARPCGAQAGEGGGRGVRGRRGRDGGRARAQGGRGDRQARRRRRGVEAVVLAAEEPTRVGGGLRLGGKPGLHDTSVGETTRYVIMKAPCRVILTAPPSTPHARSDGPAAQRTAAPAGPFGADHRRRV